MSKYFYAVAITLLLNLACTNHATADDPKCVTTSHKWVRDPGGNKLVITVQNRCPYEAHVTLFCEQTQPSPNKGTYDVPLWLKRGETKTNYVNYSEFVTGKYWYSFESNE